MSEIVKSEYNALDEQGNYKTHYFKTSADQVVGLGRMKNTEYQVGDVVYSDTNNKVALKCTTSGTTSNTELDISGSSEGDTVADGSVVWKVIDRDYTQDYEAIAQRTSVVEQTLPNKANLGALSMPSTRKINISVTTSGQEYTAPADGWICFSGQSTASGQKIQIGSGNRANRSYSSAASQHIFIDLPCAKNEVITFSYDLTARTCEFYYAQSEV
jgi:hypothetical protein